MLFKFVLAVLVLSLILPKTSQYIKWIVSAGLAQVSEFSFVLGSRARRAGIISREVSCSVLTNFGVCTWKTYGGFVWHCIRNIVKYNDCYLKYQYTGISQLLTSRINPYNWRRVSLAGFLVLFFTCFVLYFKILNSEFYF